MPKRFLAIVAALLLWSNLAFARLDINTATAEQLDGLKGIGPVKARAIVDYRRQHGPFRSVDDLQNVPGLGPAIVNGFRREVTIGAVAGEGRERPAAKPAASHPADQRPAPARPAMPARPAAEKASSPTGLPPAPARPAGAAPLPAPAQPAKAPAAPAKPAVPAQPAALARPASPASPATPAGVPPVAAPARPAMPPRPAPAVN